MSSLGNNTDNFISVESPTISTSVNNNNKFLLIIIIIVIIILVIVYVPWDNIFGTKKKEHMTGGTLTQLYANDSQDVYLKGDVDQIATGNYDLYWNQPTRVANTFLNRGSPLPSIVLPNTSMNPNNITLGNLENYQTNEYMPNPSIISENSASNKIPETPPHGLNLGDINLSKYENDSPRDELWQKMQNDLLYNKDCLRNPASCGDGPGGYRLGEGYDQGTKAKPYVDLNGNIIYPDSYVGDYFIAPNFDIMQPYPIIAKPKISALNE